MRYPAAEKLEIIRLVEQSHLPVRRTLEMLGIPRATFYRWYDLDQTSSLRFLSVRGCVYLQAQHRRTCVGRRSSIIAGISPNRSRGTATSAIWNTV